MKKDQKTALVVAGIATAGILLLNQEEKSKKSPSSKGSIGGFGDMAAGTDADGELDNPYIPQLQPMEMENTPDTKVTKYGDGLPDYLKEPYIKNGGVKSTEKRIADVDSLADAKEYVDNPDMYYNLRTPGTPAYDMMYEKEQDKIIAEATTPSIFTQDFGMATNNNRSTKRVSTPSSSTKLVPRTVVNNHESSYKRASSSSATNALIGSTKAERKLIRQGGQENINKAAKVRKLQKQGYSRAIASDMVRRGKA